MSRMSGRFIRLLLLAALAAGQPGEARVPTQPRPHSEERITLDIKPVRLIARRGDKHVFEVSWTIDNPAKARLKNLLVELELVEERATNPQKRSYKKEFTFDERQASKTQLATEVVAFRLSTVDGKTVFPSLQFKATLSGTALIPNGQGGVIPARFAGSKTGNVVVNHEEQ
jgi:hypothetical protein